MKLIQLAFPGLRKLMASSCLHGPPEMKAERWPKYSSPIDLPWRKVHCQFIVPFADDDSEGQEKNGFSYFVSLLVLARLLPF